VLRVAHRVRAIVRQNLTLAVLSIVGTCTAALTGVVPLWLTVLLHEGTTILVGLNAMRLLVPEEAEGRVAMVALLAAAAAAAFLPVEQVRGWPQEPPPTVICLRRTGRIRTRVGGGLLARGPIALAPHGPEKRTTTDSCSDTTPLTLAQYMELPELRRSRIYLPFAATRIRTYAAWVDSPASTH
jgi:hypothetical protein